MSEDISNDPTVARLHKVYSKDHSNGPGRLKKKDASFTVVSSESLKEMIKTHFPWPILYTGEKQDSDKANHVWSTNSHQKACEMFTPWKVG